MKIIMYCLVGKHEGPECEIKNGRPVLAYGWREVPVRQSRNGDFVYDSESPFNAACCPKCVVKGEPALN